MGSKEIEWSWVAQSIASDNIGASRYPSRFLQLENRELIAVMDVSSRVEINLSLCEKKSSRQLQVFFLNAGPLQIDFSWASSMLFRAAGVFLKSSIVV